MSMLAFCSASITMYELISSGAGSCFQPEMWNPQPLPAFSGRSQFSGQKFSSATLLLSEYSFGKQNDTVDWGCTCVLDSKQRPAPGTTWAWCSSAAAALGRTPWTRRTLFGASPPGPPQWLNPPRTPHATPWGGGGHCHSSKKNPSITFSQSIPGPPLWDPKRKLPKKMFRKWSNTNRKYPLGTGC